MREKTVDELKSAVVDFKKQLFDYIANNKKLVGMISLEKGLNGICKQRIKKMPSIGDK